MNNLLSNFIHNKSGTTILTLRTISHSCSRPIIFSAFLMAVTLTTSLIYQEANADTKTVTPDLTFLSHSIISGGAFSGSQGIISVNQAAGQNNIEFNRVDLSIHPYTQDLDDNHLAQVGISLHTLNETESDDTPESLTYTSLSHDAFRGSRGVVQVNQVSGTRNILNNQFKIRPPSDTH